MRRVRLEVEELMKSLHTDGLVSAENRRETQGGGGAETLMNRGSRSLTGSMT